MSKCLWWKMTNDTDLSLQSQNCGLVGSSISVMFKKNAWKRKYVDRKKVDFILELYFQIEKKFTKVWFTALRKTSYKCMYNDRYFLFVPISTLRRNRLAQSKNSYFTGQSEKSYFAEDISEIGAIFTSLRSNLTKLLSFDHSAASRMRFIDASWYKAHEGPVAVVICLLTFISTYEYANLIIFTVSK